MAHTVTGSYPIGFRRGWSDWQKDLDGLIKFARENGFECLDVGALPPAELKKITAAGLRLGTVDVPGSWGDLASGDSAKRKQAAATAAEYMKSAVAAGAKNFFCCMFPDDPARNRKESMDLAIDGYGQLGQHLKSTEARIVIEGWPGGAPHYATLCCTPEGYRAFIKGVRSDVMGINFDPSHLIRMGIDPVRFLGEFVAHVHHVHGKDTELMDDQLYEFGNLQPATLAQPHGFGGHHWRYTVPGHGVARWGMLLGMLKNAGYKGCVSIELEDEHFNGTTEGEKRGLIVSRDFLASV